MSDLSCPKAIVSPNRWIIAPVFVAMIAGMALPASAQTTRPAAKSHTIEVVGKVLDANGQPVEGARITVLQTESHHQLYQAEYIDDSILTDAEGRFTLSVAKPLRYRLHGVVAYKPGFALDWFYLRYSDSKRREVTFRLGPSKCLGGVIRDQTGAPVKGAKVIASLDPQEDQGRQKGFTLLGFEVPLLQAITGDDGRFLIKDLPEGTAADLVISGPGYAKMHTIPGGKLGIRGAYKPGNTDYEFTLAPEASAEGRVIDRETGEPVKNVVLYTVLKEAGLGELDYAMLSHKLITDDQGRFSVTGLRDGHYGLIMPMLRGDWVEEELPFVAKVGQTVQNLEFKISRGGLIEVEVVDVDGQPIPDAMVWLMYSIENGAGSSGMGTESDGIARLRLEPTRYALTRITASGFKDHVGDPGDEKNVISLAYGKTERVTIVMEKLPTIHGVALDDKGQPVTNAHAMMWGAWETATRTDGDGKFTLPAGSQADSKAHLLIIRSADGSLASVTPVKDPGEFQKVQTGPGVSAAGKVVNRKGEPVAGAVVRCSLFVGYQGYGYAGARTDASGEYRISNLAPGAEYSFSPEHGDYVQPNAIPHLELTKGKAVVTVDPIVMNRKDMVVTGIVVNPAGQPVVGATVESTGMQSPRTTTTDGKGRFRIENLIETGLRLTASLGRVEAYVDIKANQTDVRIVLPEDLHDNF